MEKTNAMRLLEQRKVAYTPLEYPVEGHVSAVEVAGLVGAPPEMVYKTLVVLRERGRPLLVMLAGPRDLDPRRLARSLGEKSVRMAPVTMYFSGSPPTAASRGSWTPSAPRPASGSSRPISAGARRPTR